MAKHDMAWAWHSMTWRGMGKAQHDMAWHSMTHVAEEAEADLKVTKAEGTASLRACSCSVSIISAKHVSRSGQKTKASIWVRVVPYLRSPHMPYWGPRIFNCRTNMDNNVCMLHKEKR